MSYIDEQAADKDRVNRYSLALVAESPQYTDLCLCKETNLNQIYSLCTRLRDSPLLGQIREALMYGEQYYGNNSKNLQIMA